MDVDRMIGILDWGIGGLGALRELRARGSSVDILYLSDSGSIPYGMLALPALTARVERAAQCLIDRGVDRIIVACNAASTVLDRLRLDVPIGGMIQSGIATVAPGDYRRVGVIGGARTIRSGVYRRGLARHDCIVTSRIAQPLSGLIERGAQDSLEFDRTLRRILRPLGDCDALLLACTHYAAATDTITALLPSTTILDPVNELVTRLLPKLDAGTSTTTHLTTGDPATMRHGARGAWNIEIEPTAVRLA